MGGLSQSVKADQWPPLAEYITTIYPLACKGQGRLAHAAGTPATQPDGFFRRKFGPPWPDDIIHTSINGGLPEKRECIGLRRVGSEGEGGGGG